MTTAYDDDTLLATLSDALAPELVEPGPELLAALHQALDARAGMAEDDDLAPLILLASPARRTHAWAGIHRLRHPVAAAVAFGVLATSGEAAAGVATDHLPGPTRTVAYALGLPVTSPALEQAKETMDQLRAAMAAGNVPQIRASAASLRTQLAALSATDRAQIQTSAGDLLTRADALLVPDAAAGGASSGPPTGGSGQGSSGSGSSAGLGPSGGVALAGTASANHHSALGSGTAKPSGGVTPVTSGSSAASPGATTPSTSSPTTTGPPATNPGTTPSTTPSTTTTTSPSTTTTTKPRDHEKGDD